MCRLQKIRDRHQAELHAEFIQIAREAVEYVLDTARKKDRRRMLNGGFKLTSMMTALGIKNTTNNRKIVLRELEKRGFIPITGGAASVPDNAL